MARLGSSNVKCLGRVAPTLSTFCETPDVKNKSAEALLMYQKPNSFGLEMKISTSKVDFSMEKFQISGFETFP